MCENHVRQASVHVEICCFPVGAPAAHVFPWHVGLFPLSRNECRLEWSLLFPRLDKGRSLRLHGSPCISSPMAPHLCHAFKCMERKNGVRGDSFHRHSLIRLLLDVWGSLKQPKEQSMVVPLGAHHAYYQESNPLPTETLQPASQQGVVGHDSWAPYSGASPFPPNVGCVQVGTIYSPPTFQRTLAKPPAAHGDTFPIWTLVCPLVCTMCPCPPYWGAPFGVPTQCLSHKESYLPRLTMAWASPESTSAPANRVASGTPPMAATAKLLTVAAHHIPPSPLVACHLPTLHIAPSIFFVGVLPIH